MRCETIVLAFSTLILRTHATVRSVDAEFLEAFFANKNCSVATSLCWRSDQVVNFRKSLAYKQMSSHLGHSPHPSFHYHVLDLDGCDKSWESLLEVSFKQPTKYLVLLRENQLNALITVVGNLSIEIDSHVVVAAKTHDGSFRLRLVYRIIENREIIWEDYGFWNGSKLTELRMPTYFDRRGNLRGAYFKVSYVFDDNETINYVHTFRFPAIDTMAKQYYGSFECLTDLCNMTYTLVLDKYYGYYNASTGKFNGIVRHLAEKTTLFSASAIVFTKERLTQVDFVNYLGPQEMRFLMRRPPISYLTGIFTLAFHKWVWACLFVLLFILSIGIYLVLKFENATISAQTTRGTVSDICLISLEAVCQQGTMTNPRSHSGMVLFFFMFLSSMIVYVAYSGNIVVIFQSTKAIKDLDDFLNTRIEAGVLDVPFMKFYVPNAKDWVRQQIYKTKIGPNGYYCLEEGLEKMRAGQFAYHVEVKRAYYYALKYFSEDEICSLQTLDGYIPDVVYAVMQKGSPFKEIITIGYKKIVEYGLHRRHFNRFIEKPKCYSVAPSFKSVGLIDAYQAFLIFFCGFAASVFVFAAEKLVYKLHQRKEDSTCDSTP